MISVYAEKPPVPLETYSHGAMTIDQWLLANVEGYSTGGKPCVKIDIGGVQVSPSEWTSRTIEPGEDVRVYPIPWADMFR